LENYRDFLRNRSIEELIAGLIKVTCYLLDQQLKRLEQDFLQEGGLRKRITRARLQIRSQQRGFQ